MADIFQPYLISAGKPRPPHLLLEGLKVQVQAGGVGTATASGSKDSLLVLVHVSFEEGTKDTCCMPGGAPKAGTACRTCRTRHIP